MKNRKWISLGSHYAWKYLLKPAYEKLKARFQNKPGATDTVPEQPEVQAESEK